MTGEPGAGAGVSLRVNALGHQGDARPAGMVRVLIVEDETLIRLGIADALQAAGLEAVETASAEDALACLATGLRIDLVLVDIHLPGEIDGVTLARLVRARRPGVQIAIISVDSTDPACFSFDLFIPKPVEPPRVAQICLELIGPAR